MIEGATIILEPFKDLGKAWEGDKIPTINRVVEGLWVRLEHLRAWYRKNSNKRHGVTFAKKLEEILQIRFPNCNAGTFVYSAGNYLDPCFKGVHLKSFGRQHFFNDTKAELEILSEKLSPTDVNDDEEDQDMQEVVAGVPLSPTSKLVQKHKKTEELSDMFSSPFSIECERYEAGQYPPKDCERLMWWKHHQDEYPRLAKVAKYILGIPASSATSERIFSAGGLTVSNMRCLLEESKVEDILLVRLNLIKVEDMEKRDGLGEDSVTVRQRSMSHIMGEEELEDSD